MANLFANFFSLYFFLSFPIFPLTSHGGLDDQSEVMQDCQTDLYITNTSDFVLLKLFLGALDVLMSQSEDGSHTLTTSFAFSPLTIFILGCNNFFPQEGRSTSASRHASVWLRLRGRIRWWSAADDTGRRTVWRGIARPSSFPTDTESTTLSSCSTTCIPSCSGSSSHMAFTSSTRFLSFLLYTQIQEVVRN